MIDSTRLQLTGALASLVFAGAAAAQEPTSATIADQAIGKASCGDVAWQPQLLATYPEIAKACQEVVVSNGTKWARFTGRFERTNRDGSVTTTIEDRDGSKLGSFTMKPAPGQRVVLDGVHRPFADLRRGQQLSLYVPESRYGVATEPGVPVEQVAEVVAPTPPEPARMAQAEPMRTELPRTAGPLPLVMLGGLVSLLGGLGLTFRRRASDAK